MNRIIESILNAHSNAILYHERSASTHIQTLSRKKWAIRYRGLSVGQIVESRPAFCGGARVSLLSLLPLCLTTNNSYLVLHIKIHATAHTTFAHSSTTIEDFQYPSDLCFVATSTCSSVVTISSSRIFEAKRRRIRSF